MANEEAIKHLNRIIRDMRADGTLPPEKKADLLVAPWLKKGSFYRINSDATSNGRPLIIMNPCDFDVNADKLRGMLGPLGTAMTVEHIMDMLAEHLEEMYQGVIKGEQ